MPQRCHRTRQNNNVATAINNRDRAAAGRTGITPRREPGSLDCLGLCRLPRGGAAVASGRQFAPSPRGRTPNCGRYLDLRRHCGLEVVGSLYCTVVQIIGNKKAKNVDVLKNGVELKIKPAMCLLKSGVLRLRTKTSDKDEITRRNTRNCIIVGERIQN